MLHKIARIVVLFISITTIAWSFVSIVAWRQEVVFNEAVSLFVVCEEICSDRFYDRVSAANRVAHYEAGINAIKYELFKNGFVSDDVSIPSDSSLGFLRQLFYREVKIASNKSRLDPWALSYIASQEMAKWFRDSHTSIAKLQTVITPPIVTTRFIENRIALLSISSFDSDYRHRFPAIIANIEQQRARGMIIDVRNNYGGDINVLCSLLSCFIQRGTPLFLLLDSYVANANVSNSDYTSDIPVVVLVNNQSYSASEMFAEVIQRTNRGTIIGEQTAGSFGAATQHFIDPARGVVLQVTEYTHRTFLGLDLEGVGVTPDIVATSDSQLENALVEIERLIINKKK